MGGFAGPAAPQVHAFDTDAMTGPARAQLLALVEQARPFGQPARQLLHSPQPWDFTHTLRVEDGARHHEITLHLPAADPPLAALVQWLEAHG